MSRRARRSERGMTMVTVAVSLTALFGLAALAVDMGKVFLVRTQLQNAADAAALAGAYTLSETWLPQPSSAQAAAVLMASQNSTIQGPVTIQTSDVTVDTTKNTVAVNVKLTSSQSVVLDFARVVGVNALNLHASALAHASTSAAGGGVWCLKPFYIANSSIAPAGETHGIGGTACQAGHTVVNPLGTSYEGQLTTYGQTYFQTQTGSVILKPSSNPDTSSQYGLLALVGGGASGESCAIQNCLNQCGDTSPYRCGGDLPLLTGNKVGPTISGVNALIGPTPDTFVAPGNYLTASGQHVDGSNSVVTVAIWDDCTQGISPGHSGSNPTAAAFVQGFIDGVDSQGNVTMHFIKPIGCTDTGSNGGLGSGWQGGSQSTGATGAPIQLIRQ